MGLLRIRHSLFLMREHFDDSADNLVIFSRLINSGHFEVIYTKKSCMCTSWV